MTDRDLLHLDIEAHSCSGVQQLQSALELQALHEERRPFSLPGDRPVWGRDRPIKVAHLKLELGFDIPRRAVHGIATTTFRPRVDGLREVAFDAIELEVESVTDDGGRALPFTLAEGKLRIDLGRARSSRRAITTVVTYSCRPRRGLYFNAPEPAYPDRPAQIWTQGQAEDSAYYFPCFDYPGEKHTSEVIATVPAGWTVVSNGHLVDRTADGRRRRETFHWSQEVPHPAYLVSLVAGELEAVETEEPELGVPVQYYGPPGSRGDLERAFGRTPDMVRFFSEWIGVPYPYAKYSTTAVADFIFGGMENTSATTMTDTLLHDERAHEDFGEVADSITAHELAHQWFGDLLTAREWPHAWLHESFATYFDALYVEHSRGHDAFRYDLYRKAQGYFAEDSGSYRRALVQNVYEEPIDIFDRHLYERGSVVLDMLRTHLGDDLWWAAIQYYVHKHAEGDVLTHDLQRAIEESTGRNLDWFFDQWVWRGGHPEFEASYAWDGEHKAATVTLTQTQQAQSDPLTSIYRTRLEIGFMTGRGFRLFPVEVTEERHSFVFPLDAEPRFVSIDPANRVLKTLKFEPGEAMLRAQLVGDPEAMGRIQAAKGLAKAGSPTAIDALRARLLDGSESELVRAEVATAFGEVRQEAAREALIAGLDARESRVRRTCATALGKFQEPEAARALGRLLSGSGDRSYYVQSMAADALGRTREASSFRTLQRLVDRPRASHNDVIAAGAITGLGALRDPRALDVLHGATEWGRPPNVRRAAVDALGELAPLADDGEQVRARERLEQLLDDRHLRVQLSSIAALTKLKDTRAVPALQALSQRALDGRVRRSAHRARLALTKGADRADDVKKLSDRIEELEREHRKLFDRLAKIEATDDATTAPADGGGRRQRPRGSRTSRGRRS